MLSPRQVSDPSFTIATTGADIKAVQEFSGHESLQRVLRYAHAQGRTQGRALEKLGMRKAVSMGHYQRSLV